MTAASARSSFRKARRASRSTQPIAVLLEEGEDEAALADVESTGAGTAGRQADAAAGETGAAPLPSGPTQAPPPPLPRSAGAGRAAGA